MALLDSEAELTLKKKYLYYISFKLVFDGFSSLRMQKYNKI